MTATLAAWGLKAPLALLLYITTVQQPGLPTANPDADTIGIEQDRAARMTVGISIDGRGPFSFMIDTGSERTVLSRGVAERLSLDAEQPATLMSMAGTRAVDMVYVPELTLGKRSYGGFVTPVLEGRHIGADGILGLDSLQGQRIRFDFIKNEIAVEDVKAAKVPATRNEIVVTARRRSGQLIFTDATIAGIKVDVVVDTGAQISIGNLALQKKLRQRAKELGDDTLLQTVTGDTIGVDMGYARDFRLGRAYFERLPLAFVDAPPFEHLGLARKPALMLGMNALRKFDAMAIDFSARKVYFVAPANAPRSTPPVTTGMSINRG
ncbi:MAG: aspartyl protease family protein [Parasphingorhabdus sp.]|nr:aspartyl protease family protein [Parasphingorhabdus sp.]